MLCKEADMANQPWLDDLREQLVKHALPQTYIRRFMDELSDHTQDVSEENMSTEANMYSRLGEPEQVAKAAVTSYRRRSFIGRHPTAAFLVFAVSPIVPQYVLGYVVTFVLALIINPLFGYGGSGKDELGPAASAVWSCLFSLLIIICTSLASVLYCELAQCFAMGKKWMFVSCAVLGLLAMNWQNIIYNGVGLLGPALLVQFIVPITVGWRFTRRKREQSYPVTAFFVFTVSPIVSLAVLWYVVHLAVIAVQIPFGFLGRFNDMRYGHIALVALSYFFTFVMSAIPLIVASLLYCKLAKWPGIGKKWMFVSCTVLATFTAMYSSCLMLSYGFSFYCLMQLVQFIIPIAVGWWFMRRQCQQGQVQMAP
jgi:hypothetical protein